MAISVMSIENLAINPNNRQPDLQLSDTACGEYIDAIKTFLFALVEQRNVAAAFGDLGYPGGYESATIAKRELQLNGGVIFTGLDECIEYVHELLGTIEMACNRIRTEL